METRKITIIDNKNQSQKVITDSKATTLGELKSEMRARGISYDGCTFYCGQMRAELKDDAAPLPMTVMYRGQEVSDLTFLLTAPEKKIKSGAMSRAEAYAEIKAKGLQGVCVEKYGKNFTQCSTADLIAVIEGNSNTKASETPKAPKVTKKEEKPVKEEPKKDETKKDTCVSNPSNCEAALKALLEDLYGNDTIEDETYTKCMTLLEGKTPVTSDKMSKREIDEMFNFVH